MGFGFRNQGFRAPRLFLASEMGARALRVSPPSLTTCMCASARSRFSVHEVEGPVLAPVPGRDSVLSLSHTHARARARALRWPELALSAHNPPFGLSLCLCLCLCLCLFLSLSFCVSRLSVSLSRCADPNWSSLTHSLHFTSSLSVPSPPPPLAGPVPVNAMQTPFPAPPYCLSPQGAGPPPCLSPRLIV